MKTYYLGSFPPPFGGVTTKNLNLYTALSEKIEIGKVDFSKIKRMDISEIFILFSLIKTTPLLMVLRQKDKKKFVNTYIASTENPFGVQERRLKRE